MGLCDPKGSEQLCEEFLNLMGGPLLRAALFLCGTLNAANDLTL